MQLKTKPYKSFVTEDDIVISEGTEVTFTTILGGEVSGVVNKIGTKAINIVRAGAINAEVWAYDAIEEGSMTIN